MKENVFDEDDKFILFVYRGGWEGVIPSYRPLHAHHPICRLHYLLLEKKVRNKNNLDEEKVPFIELIYVN